MIITLGSANLDLVGRLEGSLIYGTSNPGTIHQTLGGVGFNMVRTLALINQQRGKDPKGPRGVPGTTVQDLAFMGVLGDDAAAKEIRGWLTSHGVDGHGVRGLQGRETSRYMEILDSDRELVLGISQMELSQGLDEPWLQSHLTFLQSAQWILAECNLPQESLEFLGREKARAKLMIEGVSQPKVVKVRNMLPRIDLLKVNYKEAMSLLAELENPARVGSGVPELATRQELIDPTQDIISSEAVKVARELLGLGVGSVLVTLGSLGAWYLGSGKELFLEPLDWKILDLKSLSQDQVHQLMPEANATTTGAGDSFAAGFLWALVAGLDGYQAGRFASLVAAITCLSNQPVHPRLGELIDLVLLADQS